MTMIKSKARAAAARRIGKRMREIRGERSMQAFGTAVGIHAGSVLNYEQGHNTPGVPILIRIAQKEKVSLNWLILGRGERQIEKAS